MLAAASTSRCRFRCDQSAEFSASNSVASKLPRSAFVRDGSAILKSRRAVGQESNAAFHDRDLFEVQLQFTLDADLPDDVDLFMGAELRDAPLQLGWGMKLAATAVLGLVGAFSSAMRYSFGNEVVTSHIMFPWYRIPDRVVISAPGVVPPAIGLGLLAPEIELNSAAELFKTFTATEQVPLVTDVEGDPAGAAATVALAPEAAPKHISYDYKHVPVTIESISFKRDYTFTLAFGCAFLNLEDWAVVRVPAFGEISAKRFWGEQTMHVVCYAMKKGAAEHETSQRLYLFDFEIEHESLIRG